MLEVKNLVRVYKPKKGEPVKALDGVSLRFPDRGMIFILGKSGSGKSTLLNVMGGLDKYDSGEIIIKGKSSADFKQDDFDSYRNTYLGFIFQEYNILSEFNVGVNIGLALQLQGQKATSDEINNILEQVDLQGHGNRKPTELSGGQKQRVAIARALVKNPQIIMADEPTGALDSATGLQVFDTLKKLSKDKLVIVVTHDREFAEQYGDRVIELKDGKVISDISKYKIIAETVDDNIIVSDKVIQIKKGYELTPNDLQLINQILADDEAIISFDKKLNSGLRTSAKIDDKGNRESFKETDNAKVVSESTDEFKLIKSRLPLKHKFKMGASSLKNKPFRLLVTIFLSLIAFTMFGLADTVSAYDRVNTLTNSFLDSNISYISFSKVMRTNYALGAFYDSEISMSPEDIEKLSSDTGLDYLSVHKVDNMYIDNYYKYDNSLYYKNSVSGITSINDKMLNDFGFTLIGTLPQADDEIAITKYLYSSYCEFGYQFIDKIIKAEDITSPTAFLQEEPKINLKNSVYKITAIIDDNFNEERYKQLKDLNYSNMNFSTWMLSSELENITTYGPHCLIFTTDDAIEKIANQSLDGILINKFGYMSINSGNFFDNINSINSLSGIENSSLSYTYFGEGKLKNNEVLVSFNVLKQLLASFDYDSSKFETFYNLEIKPYTDEYIAENYQSAYDKGFYPANYIAPDELLTEEEKLEYYKLYLTDEYFHENPYGLSYNQITSLFDNIIIEDYLELYPNEFDEYLNGHNITINDYITNTHNYYEDVTIKGIVYDNANYDYNNPTPYIVSDEIFNKFATYNSGNIAFALSPAGQDANAIKKIAKYNYSQPSEGTIYSMKNEITYTLNQIDSILIPLAKAFLYIGLGLALFASIMLMNYISTSISYKKREIGILRAVGARGSDVFGIFLSESLIIALINFVLSVILTGAVVFIINAKLRIDYGLLLTLLNFGIRQFALMLAISLLVAFSASFIPVMRIARKKPIDAINNR